jgi:hypothetical protein
MDAQPHRGGRRGCGRQASRPRLSAPAPLLVEGQDSDHRGRRRRRCTRAPERPGGAAPGPARRSWSLRVAGRTGPPPLPVRRELGALLVPPQRAHPWPERIRSSRFGQLPGDLVDYTPTEPLLVVEVDAYVCFEHDRWRCQRRSGECAGICSPQICLNVPPQWPRHLMAKPPPRSTARWFVVTPRGGC